MVDPTAAGFVQRKDITGLLRYLGPMSLTQCMLILQDLLTLNFYPNPDRYSAELRASGVAVGRMEVAMGAVLGKNARQIPYEKFVEVYHPKLTLLPISQQAEVKAFWFSGTPGLSRPRIPPTIGARGDWYVTGLSAANLSILVGVGITVMTGSIEFTNVNGDKATKQLCWYGPSVGLSKAPNAKYLQGKYPALAKLMARFPTIAKILTDGGKDETIGKDVVQMLIDKSPTAAKALNSYPKVAKLIESLVGNRTAPSGGGESWPSDARGFLAADDSSSLKPEDFAGRCICIAVGGSAGAGAAVSFGTYVLFFGIDPNFSVWSDPLCLVLLERLDRKSKGCAVLESVSGAAQMPQLGVSATIFYGELV